MKPIAPTLLLLLAALTLAACGASDAALTPTEAGEASLIPPPATASAEPVLGEPTTAESRPENTGVLLSATPALSTSSPTLSPTLAITATQALSPTAVVRPTPPVIMTTTWVTATWLFRDLQVVQGERLYQSAWAQDGSAFAVGTSAGAFVYDAQSLERLRGFNIGEAIFALAFHPSEGLLALGLFNGDIQWRNPQSGQYLTAFNAHRLGVRDLAFPLGSQYLLSGGDDGRITLWAPSRLQTAAAQYQPLNTWQATDRVMAVDLHQGRQLIAAGSYQSVSIWNLVSGEPVQTLQVLEGWVDGLAFRTGGDRLAVIDSTSTLQLWETTNWNPTHQIPLPELDALRAIDFSPDSRFLALGGNNGRVVLWNLEANTITELVDGLPQPLVDLQFNPTADVLLACYQDGTLRLWSQQP